MTVFRRLSIIGRGYSQLIEEDFSSDADKDDRTPVNMEVAEACG